VPAATSPPANNTNRVGTGTNSATAGGVYTALTTRPTFTSCTVPAIGVSETFTTAGGWSIQLQALSSTSQVAFIGMPEKWATVADAGVCTVTYGPSGATALGGVWTNGTTEAKPSTLAVDGQVPYSTNGEPSCPAAGVAQFEATYSVKTSGGTVTVNP
jgi:hypothetical protein